MRYFDSFEEVTTGASPVNIDPTVFHTRITTGGTGGVEIINFPDYTSSQSGKPHLVTLVTKTNLTDGILVTGSSPITGGPFSLAVTADSYNLFKPTMMAMNQAGQGFVLTWTSAAGTAGWQITEIVQDPVLTYPFASQEQWGGYDAPATLFQNGQGLYDLAMDPTNPQFHLT